MAFIPNIAAVVRVFNYAANEHAVLMDFLIELLLAQSSLSKHTHTYN